MRKQADKTGKWNELSKWKYLITNAITRHYRARDYDERRRTMNVFKAKASTDYDAIKSLNTVSALPQPSTLNIIGSLGGGVASGSGVGRTRMGDVSGFDSRRRHFISVCNQPPKANSAFHPFWVDKLSSEQLYRMCAGRTIW